MPASRNDSLLACLAASPPRWFVAVDGGHFESLPARLEAISLRSVPLYLEAGDPEVIDAGPHLVELPSVLHAQALIESIGDAPASVFWSWPSDLVSLRRHLRTMNLVEIPNERRRDEVDPAYETVLFRHWDPNVVATFLPAFDPAQRSRFFGQASNLVVDAPDHGGVLVARRAPDFPPPARGMLRFSPAQIATLVAARAAASNRRIADYLREAAPDHAASLSERDLSAWIAAHEQEANALGLTSERSISLWCYLQLVSGGAMLREPAVRQVFAEVEPRMSADDRLAGLWNAIEHELGSA